MTKETMQAYTEIDCILSNMPSEYVLKVPEKLREKFKKEKDPKYIFRLKENKSLNEHNLNNKTRALLAMLKYNYWCKNQEEKEKLAERFNENQRKHVEYIREIYNPNDIFKKKYKIQEEKAINQNISIIEYKESNFFEKLLNRIMKFLHIKTK